VKTDLKAMGINSSPRGQQLNAYRPLFVLPKVVDEMFSPPRAYRIAHNLILRFCAVEANQFLIFREKMQSESEGISRAFKIDAKWCQRLFSRHFGVILAPSRNSRI
jgi:hypothetical protein